MNDPMQKELMVVVERAVRPVRATVQRKRRMREELLGHLIAIFEEENQRLGDVQPALDCARRRFGNPAELTRELQRTVPWRDVLGRLGEWGNERPGESLGHLAAKHVVTALAMSVATCLAILVMLPFGGRSREIPVALQSLFALCMFIAPLGFMMAALPQRIHGALHRDALERAWRTAAKYYFAGAVGFPAAFLLTLLALPGDFSIVVSQFVLACCLGPIFSMLLLAVGRKMAEYHLHEREWAELDIDS